MTDFEKLGAFYLGRHHDLSAGRTDEVPLLYDSKDLTTHAVCVGMTGSGKTGLCVTLLEEAAIDGIPALVIDPKGDLGNLLLTFPELGGKDFEPWVDPDEARRKGQDVPTFAAAQAELWRRGLGDWGQDGERIRRLREAAEFSIYTPGSEAGLPISITASFDAPPEAARRDGDLMRDRVSGTAAGLLGLLDIDADPLQSREHILLSTILDHSWRQGRGLDLPRLIHAIQSPPVDRVGVMDLDAFFPEKDRFALAMRLNNLLAAPGFRTWLAGSPLDIERLLHTKSGKPRVSIFSIAHLSESERMFFVSLLLNQTLAWMRGRPGTTSLRALLYMDEIFGYAPPTAAPPSKKPLLTLLKQARAYGLGLVLATQNPVDLDYKGLSNTGTWFLGRLQTERDKMRVLEGLEGAGDGRFDRQAMERTLAGLGKRVFLMHNVHEDGPVVFRTRWAMSYLRGPLTREQIARLMVSRRKPLEAAEPVVPARVKQTRPVLPPGVPEGFLPVEAARAEDVTYEPRLLGIGTVQYVDSRTKRRIHQKDVAVLLPLHEGNAPPEWNEATPADVYPEELSTHPADAAGFGDLPAAATEPRSYTGWRKAFSDWLYREHELILFKSPGTGLTSDPGESERDFRVRLVEVGREKRDRKTDDLKKKYATRIARLEERIRKAEAAVSREQRQASSRRMQTVVSFGATLLSALVGRKRLSAGTLGKATTTVRGLERAGKEQHDVERARAEVEAHETQLAALQSELEAELDALEDRLDPLREELEPTAVRPRRADVDVRLVTLAWVPYGKLADETRVALWS